MDPREVEAALDAAQEILTYLLPREVDPDLYEALADLGFLEEVELHGLRVQRGPYSSGGFRALYLAHDPSKFGPQGPVIRAMKGARLRAGWRAQDPERRPKMGEGAGPTRGRKRVVFDVRFTADVPAEVPTGKLRAAFDGNSVVRDPTGETVRGARWVGEEQERARDVGADGELALTRDAYHAAWDLLKRVEVEVVTGWDVKPLLTAARRIARELREAGHAASVEEVLAVWVREFGT